MSSLRLTADWMVHNNASTSPEQPLMNTRAGSPADDTLRNVPKERQQWTLYVHTVWIISLAFYITSVNAKILNHTQTHTEYIH